MAGALTSFGTAVDVGSGRGALLAALLHAHPEVRGVLFDTSLQMPGPTRSPVIAWMPGALSRTSRHAAHGRHDQARLRTGDPKALDDAGNELDNALGDDGVDGDKE